MARFNAAKMLGAIDVAFQKAYNKLIDLLDTGYMVESKIANKQIRIEITPKDGIKITSDGTSILSIDPITGEIVIGSYDTTIAAVASTVSALAGTVNSLDGSVVKKDVDYGGVSISATTGFTSTATINDKETIVQMAAVTPYKFSMMGVTNMQDYIYVTDSTGFSGPNILITSKYDINEDGVVDWKDLDIITKYILEMDISPGVVWPAGYPAFARMDVDDNGSVNSADANQIYTHMPSSDRVTLGGHQLGIDTTGVWVSEDWGDTKTYPYSIDPVPSCRVYPTSNQSIPDSTQTVIAFGGELFDTAALYNPASPTALTTPVAGIYLITATVKFASNATGTRKVSLILDGSAEIVSSEFQAAITSAANVTTVYQLAAGATVQVYAYQTSGGALNTDSSGVGMSFSMTRIA